MDAEDLAKKGLKSLLKLLWKVFLVSVWGILRLAEVILNHINGYLKQLIK